MIQPQNIEEDVNQFLSLLSLDPKQVVTMETTELSHLSPISFPCSLYDLTTHYLDFMAVPKRSFFELLACITSSEMEKERLTEFSTTDGQVMCICTSLLQPSILILYFIGRLLFILQKTTT